MLRSSGRNIETLDGCVGSAIYPTAPGFPKPGLNLTQEAPSHSHHLILGSKQEAKAESWEQSWPGSLCSHCPFQPLETFWERVPPPGPGPGPGGELVLLDPIVHHTVLGALPRDQERA